MENKKKTKVLFLEDDALINEMFTKAFRNYGYEVYSFDTPAVCPLQEHKECRCSEKQTCVDIILTDIKMPLMSGLEFIEIQRKKKCKCNNIAIMSGNISVEARMRAKELNIQLFEKPVALEELVGWFKEVENTLDLDREHLNWFLK